MVRRLEGSKHGEGTGGTSQETDDPDNPSFDPATHKSDTDKKISRLMEPHVFPNLNEWERNFAMGMYGKAPLTRKQHMKVWEIYKKYIKEPTKG